jgi:hypothetical protein
MATLLPILALSFLQQANYDQKISFAEPIQSVHSIISKIAASSQTPLAASASLPDWKMFLDCKDVPLKELMEKLADATYSDWVSDQGKLWLKPSQKKYALSKQLRIDLLRKKLAKNLEATAPTPEDAAKTYDEIAQEMNEVMSGDGRGDWSKYERLDNLNPGKEIASKIAKSLDPAFFVDLESSQRLVLSTDPTQRQFKLDLSSLKINWKEKIESMAKWEYAQARANTINMQEDESEDSPSESLKWMIEERDRKMNAQVHTVLCELSKQQFGESLAVRVSLFDKDGQLIHSDQEYLSTFSRPTPELEAKPSEKMKFSLSEEEMKFLKKLAQRFGMPGAKEPFTPAEIERLSRPDLHEPQSFAASVFAKALAAHKKKNTLLILPDVLGLAFASIPMSAEQFDPMSVLGQIGEYSRGQEIDEENWYMFYTTDPQRQATDHAPRKETAKWIAQLTGADKEEALNVYMAKADNFQFYDVALIHSMILFRDMSDMQGRRFYYRLTPDQRRKLDAGESLAVGSLTAFQKVALDDLAYGNEFRYRKLQGSEPTEYEMFRQNVTNLNEEPTIARPLGIPPDSVVSLKNSNKPVFEAVDDENDFAGWEMDEDSLAWVAFQAQRPELFGGDQGPKLFRMSSKASSKLKVTLSPNEVIATTIVRNKKAVTQKPVPFDQLPEDVLARVKKKVAELIEQNKDAKPGQFDYRGRAPKPKP